MSALSHDLWHLQTVAPISTMYLLSHLWLAAVFYHLLPSFIVSHMRGRQQLMHVPLDERYVVCCAGFQSPTWQQISLVYCKFDERMHNDRTEQPLRQV